MGESRNVRVKWTADTQQAVDATDRYKKSVTGAGQATKQTSKATQEFNQEAQSQIKTMLGVGAVVQLAGNAAREYTLFQQQAARVTFENAVAAEEATGRVSQFAEAQRIASAAMRNSMVSAAALNAELKKLQRDTEFGRTAGGRVFLGFQKAIEQAPVLGPLLGALVQEGQNFFGDQRGVEEAGPADIRGRQVRRAEQELSALDTGTVEGRRRADEILSRLDRTLGNLEGTLGPRKAAETQ